MNTQRKGPIIIAVVAVVAFALWMFAPRNQPPAEEVDEHQEAPGADSATRRGIVTLTEAAMRTAEIEVQAVGVRAQTDAGPGLEVPAQVEFDPRRVAVISPRTGGRVERLNVVEGDRVDDGQVIALLQSREFVVAQSDLQQAARRAVALARTPDSLGGAALLQAARRRMQMLGVSDPEIDRIERQGEVQLYLAINAPFAGSVTKAHVLAGEAVEAGAPLFTVADLTVVDVVAEVPERSLPLVRVGQRGIVRLAAFPDEPFEGRVERLRHELNPETRTVQAVIHVDNPAGRLRPGMFASVTLVTPASSYGERTGARGQVSPMLTIPETAVVTDGDTRYVFVETGPRTFARRAVRIAPLAPPGSSMVNTGVVVVREGLVQGERIVTRGAFTLKSELAKAGLGEHAH